MKRRYVTQAEADLMLARIKRLPSPSAVVVQQFVHGCVGIALGGTEYYLVHDDDPRAGTEEAAGA